MRFQGTGLYKLIAVGVACVVGVPMRTDEGMKSLSFANLAGNVVQNAVFVVIGDVAIEHKTRSGRRLDQDHVALPDIDNVNDSSHLIHPTP